MACGNLPRVGEGHGQVEGSGPRKHLAYRRLFQAVSEAIGGLAGALEVPRSDRAEDRSAQLPDPAVRYPAPFRDVGAADWATGADPVPAFAPQSGDQGRFPGNLPAG